VRVPHFETLRIEKRKDRLKTRPQSSLAALGRAETLSQTNQSPVMDHAKYVMMMKAKKLKAAKSQPVPEEELQRRKIQSANDRKSLGKKPISEEEFQRRLNQSAQSKLKSNAERLHVASPKEGLRPPIKRGAAETRRKTRAEMKTGATPLELLRRQIQGAASRALTLRQEGQRINPAVLQALEAMSELEILTSTDAIPGADRLSSSSNASSTGKGRRSSGDATHPPFSQPSAPTPPDEEKQRPRGHVEESVARSGLPSATSSRETQIEYHMQNLRRLHSEFERLQMDENAFRQRRADLVQQMKISENEIRRLAQHESP